MEPIHNKLNNSVQTMGAIVQKGVPFAKRNKDRRIRAVLREMKLKQLEPPKFEDVWFYFKVWLANIWGKENA